MLNLLWEGSYSQFIRFPAFNFEGTRLFGMIWSGATGVDNANSEPARQMLIRGACLSYANHTSAPDLDPVVSGNATWRPSVRRRAFTMVELMIVMGVILVLIGMLLYGLKSFSNGSKTRETKATLEIASGMLTELDAKVKLGASNCPPVWWQPNSISDPTSCILVDGAAQVAADPEIDFWHMSAKFNISGTQRPAPIRWRDNPSVNVEDVDLSTLGNAPYPLKNSFLCMSRLMGALPNRQKMEGLPPQRVARPSDDPTTNNFGPNLVTVDESRFPIPRDGWGNPIIFVPASGLQVKMLNGHSKIDASFNDQDFIVISPEGQAMNVSSTPPTPQNGISPGVVKVGRPFFASAGPDGDFSTGDDNIYSFEQQ
jgi:prepilin-type N-terminal cleavage/methylation domain-containing protein